MALAVTCRLSFVDGKGKPSFTKIRIPTGFSISQMLEFAVAVAQLATTISVGSITRASICVGIDLSSATIKASPMANSDIAEKGLFGWATAVSGFRTKSWLPAFSEAMLVNASDAVDQVDADVAAYITAMENGIVVTGGTVQPTDRRENDVVGVEYAIEKFRSD